MKNNNKDIWVGIEDKTNDPAYVELANQEFAGLPDVDQLAETGTNRRDFLKYLGFGLGAATIAAGCEAPVRRAIPYVTKPDEIVPGVATYYASSFVNGGDYCAILVKTREGRPIKIEGNAMSKVTNGGTSARAQACVLDLYDTNRFKAPQATAENGRAEITWADLDKQVGAKLSSASNIRIITNTILSPTTKKVLAEFQAKYPNAKVVTYDPISCSAMLQANEATFGDKVIPDYRFDKADVIVSFNADFLGTWISPVEYAHQYAKNRSIKDAAHPKMSRHIQVEGGMTLTGSNADNRILVKPSEQGAAIATLYNAVAKLTGGESCSAPKVNDKAAAALRELAKELVAKKGKSLVVAGSNNKGEQILVNKLNDLLGNYGSTISFTEASLQRQGVDADIQALVKEMNGGRVDCAIVLGGANPAFDLPNSAAFVEGFNKVKTKISFAITPDETTALCDYLAPNHHLLESWGDAEPKRGHLSLIQPTIAPLFNTRQTEETLLRWAESANCKFDADQPYYEYLKAAWTANAAGGFATGSAFWDSALHDGVAHIPQAAKATVCTANVSAAAAKITKPGNSELEMSFYETVGIGAGQYANNPWLQEMPDPVTRCAWGNYLTVPVYWEGKNSFRGYKGVGGDSLKKNKMSATDIVAITAANDVTQNLVATPSFGQMDGTMSIGLGYGREVAGLSGKGIGTNVYPMLRIDSDGNTQYYDDKPKWGGIVGTEEEFACVQYHHTFGVKGKVEGEEGIKNVDERELGHNGYDGALTDRSIIYTTNVNSLTGELAELKEKRKIANQRNNESLYPYEKYNKEFYSQGHHWGMHIDLNACIGCAACTVACMSENNVPVVGKREIHRHHEMTWLRIDRYFYGDVENPNVVYQPMMCQHCDNAPCENVCPVAATNHSSEGLNQMTYNRCIGTRYCANNCPYKVRRFNWLDYTTADLFPGNQNSINGEAQAFGTDNLTRMVLNPDVTVRSRGVIEKCSFCVQRIQEGKLVAKREGRRLREGDVKSACQTACPTGAITFGDMNDKRASISKKNASPLTYRVLEEINTLPSVHYTMKVNNRSEKLDA